MVDITIFRIDLGGSSFTATPPFGGDDDGEPVELDTEAEADSDGRGRGIAVVVGLVFLIVVALVVKRVLDGGLPDETG